MVTLILHNSQGASDVSTHDSRFDVQAYIDATWSDPENMTARLIDRDGIEVYSGPADSVPTTSTADFPCSSDEWSAALGL